MAATELGRNPTALRWTQSSVDSDGNVDDVTSYTYKAYLKELSPAPDSLFADFAEWLTLPAQLTDPNTGEFVADIQSLSSGNYQLYITATDPEGEESVPSNTVGFTRVAFPAAPVILGAA